MHLHTLTTVAGETYPDWVLRSLQNLNIDSVAYNHAVSEQNWNKQASLWCVSVCASRGLGGTPVLTPTKAYKTKMAARFLNPHDQPGVKNTPGVTRRRRSFPFALDTWSSMLAERWFSICNRLRWFDFDTSHIQEFHIKSLYIAKFEKIEGIKEIQALLWASAVPVPSFRLTSAACHPWLCYYRVVMLL